MFQGRMSRSALEVIDGSSRTRSNSGENRMTPAIGRWLVEIIEYMREATSPPPLESPATNSRDGSTPPTSRPPSPARRPPGRPGTGTREPTGCRRRRSRTRCGRHSQATNSRVHAGRGADVPATVEVEDGARPSPFFGRYQIPGRRPRGGLLVHIDRAHQGREHHPAQVVEHHFDRPPLGDGHGGRVTHERTDASPG